MSEFSEDDVGRIFSWSDVSAIHRTRHGIYQRNGELISLLTDLGKLSPCYPDVEAESADTILYTGAGRRGNQKLDVFNNSLLTAIRSETAVPLFCKLDVNRWEYKGRWRVMDGEYAFEEKRQRMVWRFVLKRVVSGVL